MPPLTTVSVALEVLVSAPVGEAILVDHFPAGWTVIEALGGSIDPVTRTVRWALGDVSQQASRTYIVMSPQRTVPPTKYFFATVLLSGETQISRDDPYMVLVSDPTFTTATSSITFANRNLDGGDGSVAGATGAWVSTNDTESGGWNLTVSSTDFENDSDPSRKISVGGFSIKLDDANVVTISGNTKPSSTATAWIALSGTPLKIASAAVGQGIGQYDITPDFTLNVPAETFAGSYTGTVTIDMVTGP